MKIYPGKFNPEYSTTDNSLVANLLKYPEIAKKIIELYPRYSMTYLLERLGFGASEKVIGANSFEWKTMGRYKSKNTVAASVTGRTHVQGTEYTDVYIDHAADGSSVCSIHANDIIRFADGVTGLVTNVAAASSNKKQLTYKALSTRAGNASQVGITHEDVVAIIGSAFGQGSEGSTVGEFYAYPETHKNWLTLSRRKCKINGVDLHDITWVEHNGSRLWYFTKEQQMTDSFMYELELNRWFGKASFAQTVAAGGSATNAAYPGDELTSITGVPVIGDGILAQIAGSNVKTLPSGSYSPDKSELLAFIAHLSLNARNSRGNEWVVFTGMAGMVGFQEAMETFIGNSNASLGSAGAVMTDKAGQDISVGGNFSTYYALGNKITLVHNPCFDDPNVSAMTSGLAMGNSELSRVMVFMDMSQQDGVANVELIAKGAEGFNRNYVKKYVPGMINPNDPNSMMAATGNDTFECHILSESGVIVRNPQSCGVIIPAGLTI
tara:strand:+ start:466 stop:1947 length:1482 start_codon:yes stop_codon:yes gene_type:complete